MLTVRQSQLATAVNMSTQQPNDIDAALDAAHRPARACPMPHVGVKLAIATSPMLHRLLPGPVAVAAGEARGRLLWSRSADVRERARAAMSAIVGGTERAGEVESLARRHVIERQVLLMLFWQPPRQARIDERSRVNIEAALAAGRGVLFSVCHLAAFWDALTPLQAWSQSRFAVVGGWWFATPTADYAGRRLVRFQQRSQARQERLVCSLHSFAVIESLLGEGQIVESFFDIPGSRETRFLGKRAMLASGTARLAAAADAIVLPARTRRVGHRMWVDVSPALDSRDFADFEQLHDTLAAIHSGLILDVAETLEDPRRPGVWEAGATADSWVMPRQAAAAGAARLQSAG
jgi:lauroyl/myristoyl acyltransferase